MEGERVQISGQLLVDAIMTTGINIDDAFVVTIVDGKAQVSVNGDGIFTGSVKTPFKVFESFEDISMDLYSQGWK